MWPIGMETVDENGLVDKSCVNLTLDVLTRLEVQVDIRKSASALITSIHPPHQVCHPCDVVLCRNNLETRKALEHFAEYENCNRSLYLMMKRGAPNQAIGGEEIDSGTLAGGQDVQ